METKKVWHIGDMGRLLFTPLYYNKAEVDAHSWTSIYNLSSKRFIPKYIKALIKDDYDKHVTIHFPRVKVFDKYLNIDFNKLTFKILYIFYRPRDKHNGEKRELVEQKSVPIQKVMSHNRYYFIVEDSQYNQIFIIRANLLIKNENK